MSNTYTLTRIVRTDTDALRFIWNDGYEQVSPADWTGWFRAVTSGWDDAGEYERYDGTDKFNNADIVADVFVANGGTIEAYVAPADPV